MKIKVEPLDEESVPQDCDTFKPDTFKIEPVDVPIEDVDDLRDSNEWIKVEETAVCSGGQLADKSVGYSLRQLPEAGSSETPDMTTGGEVLLKCENSRDDPDCRPSFGSTTETCSEESGSELFAEARSPTDRVEERSKIIDELRAKINLSDPSTLTWSDGSKSHLCLVCSYETEARDYMVVHVRTHTGEKPFACSHCDYRCVRRSRLRTHMRTHTGEKPYACPHCDYRCAESSGLRVHMRTHTDEKPHVCPHCDFKTRRLASLEHHLMTHLTKKPLECPHCDYRCIERGALVVHLRTHSGEKPFACPDCDYRGTSQRTLNNHLRGHTGEKPYVCSFCGYAFATSATLKRHVRIHTGEKPYACEHCDHRCVSSSQLKAHTRRHAGGRAHACTQCDYSCLESSDLRIHMSAHTDENLLDCSSGDFSTRTAASFTDVAKHDGKPKRRFRCQLCPYKGRHISYLRSHMQLKHRDKALQNYSCHRCDYNTVSRLGMKLHVLKHAPTIK